MSELGGTGCAFNPTSSELWTLKQRESLTPLTGPSVDHTTGTIDGKGMRLLVNRVNDGIGLRMKGVNGGTGSRSIGVN